MYNEKEYKALIQRLQKDGKLISLSKGAGNIQHTKYYYDDLFVGMFRHMHNMIETYGKNNVKQMLQDLINDGTFNE